MGNLGFLGSLYGPPAPGRPDRPWNRHAMNNALARNKLSCTIDNRRPAGHELLMRLAGRDMFIDNFKANGLVRWGSTSTSCSLSIPAWSSFVCHRREPRVNGPATPGSARSSTV